jgi:hypothetical protein
MDRRRWHDKRQRCGRMRRWMGGAGMARDGQEARGEATTSLMRGMRGVRQKEVAPAEAPVDGRQQDNFKARHF